MIGSTTYDLMNRCANREKELAPDMVLIWVGTNDFMPSVPKNTEAEIAEFIMTGWWEKTMTN